MEQLRAFGLEFLDPAPALRGAAMAWALPWPGFDPALDGLPCHPMYDLKSEA